MRFLCRSFHGRFFAAHLVVLAAPLTVQLLVGSTGAAVGSYRPRWPRWGCPVPRRRLGGGSSSSAALSRSSPRPRGPLLRAACRLGPTRSIRSTFGVGGPSGGEPGVDAEEVRQVKTLVRLLSSSPSRRIGIMAEAVPIREKGQSKKSTALTVNEQSELVDAVLTASRVMVAIDARSLGSSGEDVTLPQFRALVLMGAQGPLRPADLAEALSVDPSTVTRLCDRLETKKLISRRRIREDRREVWIRLSSAGQQFLDAVTDNRRTEIARIIALLPLSTHSKLFDAFTLFGVAAGETPERNWTQAWQL